jgi:uncharacterized protein (DUF2141 family)
MPALYRFFKLIIFLLLNILIVGCASVSSITGGPKDEQPPRLLYSSPKNNATEYKGKEVVIVFDEHITLNNISQQLLIAPYMKNPFKHKLKKNKLTLSFEQSFPENTTIQLNFREAIKDATEGNIFSDFKLAFSTGSQLDSLFIQGNVTELLTEKPAAQATVVLYDINDTASILKGKPLYLTKTNKEGKYKLENLKKGKYMLFAFMDNNQNLVHDFKELVGFVSDTIQLDTNLQKNISIFYCDDRTPLLQRASTQKEQVILQFSKGIYQLQIKSLQDTTQSFWYKWEKLQEKNRAIVFNNWQKKDSVSIIVTATDSVGNSLIDTANVFFGKADTTLKRKIEIEQKPTGKNIQITPKETITWTFSLPVVPAKDSLMLFYIDSTKYQVITKKDIEIDENHLTATLQIPDFKKQANIFWLKGSFLSVSGDTLPKKTDTLLCKLPNLADFGTISGEVTSITDATNFTVELLSNDLRQVIKTIRNQKKFTFTLVPPSSYRLRLIVDENNNQKWDSGTLQPTLKQPEKVYLLPDVIQLKANWDLEGFKL